MSGRYKNKKEKQKTFSLATPIFTILCKGHGRRLTKSLGARFTIGCTSGRLLSTELSKRYKALKCSPRIKYLQFVCKPPGPSEVIRSHQSWSSLLSSEMNRDQPSNPSEAHWCVYKALTIRIANAADADKKAQLCHLYHASIRSKATSPQITK